MISTDLIGYTAALLTTVAFIPQAVKSIKYRDTSSLSLVMYIVFTAGVLFWLLYGIIMGDTALVVANGITGMLSSLILAIKIKTDLSGSAPGVRRRRYIKQ